MNEAKRIVVASRHSIVRHGLKLMLQGATPHIVLGDGRPLAEMLSMVEEHRPDLLVADVQGAGDRLPDMALALAAARRKTQVLLLLDPGAPALHAWRDWASDAEIILSTGDPIDVVRAIRRLVPDEMALVTAAPAQAITLPPAAHDEPSRREPATDGALHITSRERQVMQLVRQGLCNKKIARALDISVTTVRSHRQNLMAKLGLHNAVEIARFAADALDADEFPAASHPMPLPSGQNAGRRLHAA